MWVLTESYNDYDQHGDYLITAWSTKPSIVEFNSFLKKKLSGNEIKKLYNDGTGTRIKDYQWYYFKELKEGEQYKSRF